MQPRAAEIDRSAEFPYDLYKKMAALGLLGLMVPEAGGGSGGDTVMQGLVQEELGYASATVADIQAAALEVALTLHEHAPAHLRRAVSHASSPGMSYLPSRSRSRPPDPMPRASRRPPIGTATCS